MGKRLRRYWWLLLVALPVLYLAACEYYYHRHMRPDGVTTFLSYCLRYGDPPQMTEFVNEGKPYYEVRGEMPPAVILVFPASPHSYLFNAEGYLVDWCDDPDSSVSYREKWPNRTNAKAVDIADMKMRWNP